MKMQSKCPFQSLKKLHNAYYKFEKNYFNAVA